MRGAAWAVAIFAYFTVFTVWVPSWILSLPIIADAPAGGRDLVGTGVWMLFLIAGLVALRRLQGRGRI